MLLSANGEGTNAIMAATGTAKTTVWRFRARFMDEYVDALLRDGTRPPGTAPIVAIGGSIGAEGFAARGNVLALLGKWGSGIA